MKKIFYILSILLVLTSCSYDRLHPCCRIMPGYGGFDKTRTLTLLQNINNEKLIIKTGQYLILLDKNKTLDKAEKYLKDTCLNGQIRNSYSDTLDLTELKNNWLILEFLTKQVDHKNAVIINSLTGQKLEKVKRYKWNAHPAPLTGSGGKSYSDPKTDSEIIRIVYWRS